MNPHTASELLALALGRRPEPGTQRCFLCAAPCSETHSVIDCIKESFTGRSEVACPGSPSLCIGCTLSLREDVKMPGRDKPQRMRTYSWVITSRKAKAYSKADRKLMRQACLSPPAPPFAICLAESGQKHLLYRTPVNHARETISLSLETEIVTCAPSDLRSRLILVGRLIAATGKPGL